MDSLVHPSELSIWHRFLQARRLHRETSRSRNTDWYRHALELDLQLHLFVEGAEIRAAHVARRTANGFDWKPVAAPQLETEAGELQAYLKEFRSDHLTRGVRSLGVILHLGDEFAISELAPFNEAPEDLGLIRDQLVLEPQEVLEDQSVSAEDLSFRFFPYAGTVNENRPGAAITISRRHQEFLRHFRAFGEQINLPVRTAALSAPLVALGSLPHIVQGEPGRPFCVFFSYSAFSVLAFFRGDGELMMLRSVRHHAGCVPANIDVVIQTMAVALELDDPAVIVLPLSQVAESPSPRLANSSVYEWRENTTLDGEVPLEFQGAVVGPPEGEALKGIALSRTFSELASDAWALQDFLQADQQELDLYPGEVEMKAMRYGGLAFKAVAAVLLLFLAWGGIRMIQIVRDPAWHAKGDSASSEGTAVLTTKIKRFEQWDALLADRSKAWVTMELLSRLFPNPSAIVITNASHEVRPDAVRDQEKVSIVKDWKISGFANDAALDHLTAINTREGIRNVFNNVFEITGDESMNPDLPTRNLVVNLLASENKRFDPEKGTSTESQFPFIFNLTIKQGISAEDPLAIPTSAAP